MIPLGPVDPKQPFQLRLPWISDNYSVNTKPVVFQISPMISGRFQLAPGHSAILGPPTGPPRPCRRESRGDHHSQEQ